ncbi:MAG: hypothetical protein R3F62_06040 [Planctomycetota bacterium]
MAGHRIRLRPWFRWALPRTLAAVVLYVGGYTALNWHYSAVVAEGLAAARARGEPATADELLPAEVSPARDAGPFFRAACALADGFDERIREEFGGFEPYVKEFPEGSGRYVWGWVDDAEFDEHDRPVPADLQAIDAWLQRMPGLQELLDEVRRRPECKSTIDFGEDGPYTLLPHLLPAKNLCLLTLASSAAAAERGDMTRAVDQLLASHALTRCLFADRYCLISALVAASCRELVHAQLQLLLSHGLPAAELERLARGLEETPDMPTIYREAVIGERSGLGSFMFQAMLQGRRLPYSGDLPAATGPLRLLLLWDFGVYLDVFRDAVAHPWPGFGKGVEDVGVDMAALRGAPISALMIPALGKFRGRLIRVQAQELLARCALSLERERLEGGAYPSRLPMGFEGVRYTPTPEGYVLRVRAVDYPGRPEDGDEVLRIRR